MSQDSSPSTEVVAAFFYKYMDKSNSSNQFPNFMMILKFICKNTQGRHMYPDVHCSTVLLRKQKTRKAKEKRKDIPI